MNKDIYLFFYFQNILIMRILFDTKKLENLELEDFPIILDFGFNIVNIKISDFFRFIEDLIECTYELEEKESTFIEISTESEILRVDLTKKNNKVKIYLNNNLIEKTTFDDFVKNINSFFNEIIPYLRKIIFEEIKEEGEDSIYIIILGKIYEWQEDFYDVIDSSNL